MRPSRSAAATSAPPAPIPWLAGSTASERISARLSLHVRDFAAAEKAARAFLARPGHGEEEDARQALAESLAGLGLYRQAADVYRLMAAKNPDSRNIRAASRSRCRSARGST